MTDVVLNPVDIERNIRAISERIANGVRVCDQRYREFLTAERTYDQAFARAYMTHDGPAHERKYAAELATATEREARDVADAAYPGCRAPGGCSVNPEWMNQLIAHLGDPVVLSHVGTEYHLEWHDGMRVSAGYRGGRYEARARGAAGSVRLRRPDPPTDWQMLHLCVIAGLLPDVRELAAAHPGGA